MADRESSSRGAVASRAIWLGLGISATAGAIGGTFAFPVLGTIYGLVVGVAAGVVPVSIGTVAFTWAARPGVTAEAYRQRAIRVLVVLGATVAVLGTALVFSVLDSDIDSDSYFQGPALLGVVAAVGLLAIASRRLSTLPDPSSDRTASLTGGAAILIACLIITATVVLPAQLGPDARGKRAAAALRNQSRKDFGFHPESTYTRTGGTRCAAGKHGYFSSVSGPVIEDQIPARLASAKAGLARRGFAVEQGDDQNSRWVYGGKSDREVTVTVSEEDLYAPGEIGVVVEAHVNCPNGPPP